jgi:hypothetical protein
MDPCVAIDYPNEKRRILVGYDFTNPTPVIEEDVVPKVHRFYSSLPASAALPKLTHCIVSSTWIWVKLHVDLGEPPVRFQFVPMTRGARRCTIILWL